MCSNPSQIDGQQVACRVCPQCIQSYKSDWVCRALAEADTAFHSFQIELTYRNNDDGTAPAGAVAFQYRDVQLFMKLLRETYFKKYEVRGEIRYIVAGEKGSKNGRAHWHLLLYSNKPIHTLGDWSDIMGRPQPGMRYATNMHWSIWPHGFVYVQRLSQKSVSYSIKYAIKDRLTSLKSQGTMNESRSETYAASLFRMSKKPPVGWTYLERICEDWRDRRVVPVTLDIKIPGYSSYWYPRGKFREYLLQQLHDINLTHQEEYGSDCPQWAALLASVVSQKETDSQIRDLEGLIYGEVETIKDETWFQKFRAHLAEKQRIHADAHERAKIRRTCGRLDACAACRSHFTDADRTEYRDWQALYAQQARNVPRYDGKGNAWTPDRHFVSENRPNPFCFHLEQRYKYFTRPPHRNEDR